MKTQRFEFALERLQPGDWARFEQFASQYLVYDYGNIRSVATASGDLGRDSEIFSPEGDPLLLMQYSVSKNWEAKIKKTAERIRVNFPDATILVYVTNQQIGALADSLKKEIRKDFKLVLDLHDRKWFLDRMYEPEARVKIAELLAQDIVDPYLSGKEIVDSKALALTEYESKAAVLHLQLQWEDDAREKGLTKLCYEGLVKSVLRETSSENRMKEQDVSAAIQKLLPNISPEIVLGYVSSAIERLDKKAVKRWRGTDEICLSHEEVLRVREGMAQKEIKDGALSGELKKTIQDYFDEELSPEILDSLCVRARRILDQLLLKKGEEFASAVANNRSITITGDTLDVLVANDFGTQKDDTKLGEKAVSAVRLSIAEVLQRSGPQVHRYLREIADGYTLFGFLRAVPDVQKVVQKIFSEGEVWIDTSVLLPVMAETLVNEDEQIASRLLRAASSAGLKLRVTPGVIEEVERHINRCMAYIRTTGGAWMGGVPFLYAMYSIGGHTVEEFQQWIKNFCGSQRPLDDIVDYLEKEWGVEKVGLAEYVEAAPKKLRWEIERIWREAHEQRRAAGHYDVDAYVIDRLVEHDVECFLGVIGKRERASGGDLGYSHWWLTFDKTVRDFERKLGEALGSAAPKVPVMSPDFLADYLAIGPLRARVNKEIEASLPVAMFDLLSDQIPVELLDVAGEVRKDCGVVNERLLRRRLRDTMDIIKRARGVLANGGFAEVRTQIERALKARKP